MSKGRLRRRWEGWWQRSAAPGVVRSVPLLTRLPPLLPLLCPCREVLVMVMRKHQRYFPVYKHQSGEWGWRRAM